MELFHKEALKQILLNASMDEEELQTHHYLLNHQIILYLNL